MGKIKFCIKVLFVPRKYKIIAFVRTKDIIFGILKLKERMSCLKQNAKLIKVEKQFRFIDFLNSRNIEYFISSVKVH